MHHLLLGAGGLWRSPRDLRSAAALQRSNKHSPSTSGLTFSSALLAAHPVGGSRELCSSGSFRVLGSGGLFSLRALGVRPGLHGQKAPLRALTQALQSLVWELLSLTARPMAVPGCWRQKAASLGCAGGRGSPVVCQDVPCTCSQG